MVQDHVVGKSDDEIPDADYGFRICLIHRYMPMPAKKMANRPSSTMTRKIDLTTDVVV